MHVIQLPRRFVRDDWGGTETVVLETSKHLQKQGHRTEIFCTTATASCRREEIEGVLVTRFPYFYPYLGLGESSKRTLDRRGGSPFSFSLLRGLKKCQGLDLLHVHCGNRIGGIGRYAAVQRRIPYVVSLHGGLLEIPKEARDDLSAPTKGTFDWGKILGWWVGSRRVHADAAAILCVGQGEQQVVQKQFPNKKVVYLPNGVDIVRFEHGDRKGFRYRHGIGEDSFLLLTVARIDSQKNQLAVVRELPSLLERIPSAHVLMVGPVTSIEYHDRIVRESRTMGLESRITIIPGIPAGAQELVDCYHAADLFLLPSTHEPFGIVILEAWASGLPVVASEVGGVPYFVTDGEDGVLFDVSVPGRLAQTVGDIAANPARMKSLAASGRRKARAHYGWDRITEKLVAIYEEAVRENPFRQ